MLYEKLVSTEKDHLLMNRIQSIDNFSIDHFSLMFPQERVFLTSLILKYKPKKMLELGVYLGGSSVIMLNAAKEYSGAKLYSSDLIENHTLPDSSTLLSGSIREFETGYVVNKYFTKYHDDWKLFTPGLVNTHLDVIGKDIDFVLIDTAHVHPGEILDTILILPYLKKGAVVVYHDTALHCTDNHPYCNTTANALGALKGKLILPPAYFMNQSVFSNISAVELDPAYSYKQQAMSLFIMLFSGEWIYFYSEKQMQDMFVSIEKHYGKEGVILLQDIITHQKKWINNLEKSREQKIINKIKENERISKIKWYKKILHKKFF
jgi:predicted O-methyltransferase YrrM